MRARRVSNFNVRVASVLRPCSHGALAENRQTLTSAFHPSRIFGAFNPKLSLREGRRDQRVELLDFRKARLFPCVLYRAEYAGDFRALGDAAGYELAAG